MRDVVIASAVRTPVGKNRGFLREWSPPVLLGRVLDEALQRISLDPGEVEDVLAGCVAQVGEQGFCLARMAVLASSLPESVPGTTLNRLCGSSLTAIQMAWSTIACGAMDVIIACGCEHMSKYTIVSDMNGTLYNGQPMGNPFGDFYTNRYGRANQIVSAQMVADQWDILQEQCEDFAIQSHAKAARATEAGYFQREIMPLEGLDSEGNGIVRDTDETIRPQTSRETLRALKTLPGTRFITAGLSSTITDGASAVVLMTAEKAAALGISPLARIRASTVVGSDPKLMLTGPIPATRKILKIAGMRLADIDLYEVNEAFAPVPLAWEKELGADREKLNVNGGALALGHPVGNSGSRLTVTALYELIRRKARTALVTLCTGGGMAPAVIYERPDSWGEFPWA